MSFAWSKKFQPQVQIEETVQEVNMPVYEANQDKISVTEHKNGKCLVSSREKNNAFGSREEEINGKEMVLPCIKDGEGILQERTGNGQKDSSPFASLKK